MEFTQLRTLLAIVEHGSFSRAAQSLRVGQSTVSFHVRALEAALGARVLDRGGRRVRATPVGQALLGYARRLVALHDDALARLGAEQRGTAGRVVIAASTVPAEHLLPALLAELRRRHPGVAMRVDVSDSERAVQALLAH